VKDSDVEMETATSNPSGAANKSQNRIENISDDEKENTNITNEVAVTVSRTKANVIQPNDTSKAEASKPTEDVKVIDKTAVYRSKARDEDVRVISKVPKDENLDISRDGACDIIFSQDLVVKRPHRSAPAASTEGGVNFKRFRKVSCKCNIFSCSPFWLKQLNVSMFTSGPLTFYFRGKQCQETASRTLFHLHEIHTGKSQKDFH